MPNIRHELLIAASAEALYRAITSQDGSSAWWTPDAQVKAEVNSIARFGFGPNYFKEMKIVELKPHERVEWNCITGAEEWVGTTISFELHAGNKETLMQAHPELADQLQQQRSDGGTVLILHHDGWKTDTPMFAECSYTWGRFLRSLKLLLETGKGHPWPQQHRISEVEDN